MFAESVIARNHHEYLHQKSTDKGHGDGAIVPTQPRPPRNTIPESDKDEDGRDDEEYDARNPDQVGMALGGRLWSEERHLLSRFWTYTEGPGSWKATTQEPTR